MRKATVFFLGLAVCCTVAFSSPIKSVLGANASKISKERGDYTAADYVQDGLVSLFDGIETGGYGVTQFGESGFVWQNCITEQSVLTSDNTCSLENGVATSYAYGYPALPMPPISEWTYEVVCTLPRNAKYGCWSRGEDGKAYYPLLHGGTVGDDAITIQAGSYATSATTYISAFSSIPLVSAIFTRGPSSRVCYLYLEGTYSTCRGDNNVTNFPTKITFGDYTAVNSIGNMRINCIRLYNRVLTADEIEYNRQIDEKRFGT